RGEDGRRAGPGEREVAAEGRRGADRELDEIATVPRADHVRKTLRAGKPVERILHGKDARVVAIPRVEQDVERPLRAAGDREARRPLPEHRRPPGVLEKTLWAAAVRRQTHRARPLTESH